MTLEQELIDWIKREMPEGTVIGNPEWWASRIARRVRTLGAPRVPEPVAHVFPDDMERLKCSECAVTAYSVEMGDPDRGETLPLYTAQPTPDTDELARLRVRVAELENNYSELLYEVSEKTEGQSRHETALSRLAAYNKTTRTKRQDVLNDN